MTLQWVEPETSEPARRRSRTNPRNNKNQQDKQLIQAKVPKKNYPGLSKFQNSPEVDKFKAAHKQLVRLSQFVKPPPRTRARGVGSSAAATTALSSVAAMNAACDIEEDIEELLEETLAKFDRISDRFCGEVEGLRELVLAGDEWYEGGLMLSLEEDEFKKALAQATTITDATDFRLHVEQAMNSMPPRRTQRRNDPYRDEKAMRLKCKLLTCIGCLGRFGAEGTRQAFHLLVFTSTHDWAHEPRPSARRFKPGSRPMGVKWKMFAGVIGSGPDKQVDFQGNWEAQWFESFVGTAVPDWQPPNYWDFCAAYRTMTRLCRISGHTFRCACEVSDCAAGMRLDWLRELAVDEVKGKLNWFAPPDLPVELMDLILDLALQAEGISVG
ncbi:hypothetical protein KC351_g10287 [Hortaea werneckii]|nr:hypothetical protein KC351_g10287 [Hortaea werneckii]